MTACQRCGFDPTAAVTASWVFMIERDPPSLNARIHNSGASRWQYRAERDVWSGELMVARVNHRITPARRRRRVTLERVYGGRQKERDRDNLVGGMKAVVDALVLQGLLVDDTPAHAELHYGQLAIGRVPPPGMRGLRVTIEDLA